MRRVSVEEAAQQLPELAQAVLDGEEVFIYTETVMLQLIQVDLSKPRPKFGSAKGLIEMRDDFDAPLDDFREYTE